MEVILIKKPYEISFSGNPMPFSFAISPYGDVEKQQDIRLQVRVLYEELFNSNVFTEIKAQDFYPDSEGKIEIDVQSVMDAYLEWYTPKPGLKVPVQAPPQRKRYKLSYFLQKNGALETEVADTEALHAIKGGMAIEHWHRNEFFTNVILQKKMPLLFAAKNEKVAENDTRFLYWIYPYADMKPQTITYKVYLNNGATVSQTITHTIATGKWGVCCIPSGFQQCGLHLILPEESTAQKYSIKIATVDNVIVNEYFFLLDQRFSYDSYQLMYRNSIGGLDTQRLLGQVEVNADYDRQQAQKTLPPAYFQNLNMMAAITDEAAFESVNSVGDTGFISKEHLIKCRDLLLSRQIFEVVSVADGQVTLLPAVLNMKKASFFTNKDSLLSLSITWQSAFLNKFFTPGAVMPIARTCPAVLDLSVVQLNKNFLQIMYSLEEPYTKIQVELVISGQSYVHIYDGNVGIIKQKFVNPSSGAPVTITINARTICNDDIAPFEMGPIRTISLDVTGSTGLIANDDTYKIAQGYNSSITLSGSALANDYDPDGDAIEVIAASGSSTKGGLFSINASGIISYKPPSSVWLGVDNFPYSIRKTGTTPAGASAVVYINVGDAPSGIFVKKVIRNFSSFTSQYTSGSSGEMWLEFYKDPSGTQKLDVTQYGITVVVTQKHYTGNAAGEENVDTTDISVLGTGTEVKFYDGLLGYSDQSGPATDGSPEIYENYSFTLQPGSGYNLI